ncbi:MAG: hypothetical protein HGB22_11230 [Chlorobiaceae bacterium]|nr:hypothetical protein [Chlorobiaceae bacterium]
MSWLKKERQTASGSTVMDDLDRYFEKRKRTDPEFAANFDEGVGQFNIGFMLRQARTKAVCDSGLGPDNLIQEGKGCRRKNIS